VSTLLDTLPPPSTDGVDKLYHHMGEILAIALRNRWSAPTGAGLKTQPLARSALGPIGRRMSRNPPWQGRHHHKLGFHPRARHGNRASVPNPLHVARLVRGTWACNPNATCGTHARADTATGCNTVVVLRDKDQRHLRAACATCNSRRLFRHLTTFLGTPSRSCSVSPPSTPLARR
jgi:DNA-directed RNA polymerase subunit RPC12/RpoP